MIDGGKLYGTCEVDGLQLAACYYADSTGELDYVRIEENESDYTYNSNGTALIVIWMTATCTK